MGRTIYISRKQIEQLLKREIDSIDRTIPKELIEQGKALKVHIKLSN